MPVKIFHFHNGIGGGVLSVIRNLLRYRQHPEIENHVIYTINKEKISRFEIPKLEGATSEQIFYYSPRWNFYYTCRQLAKLLHDDKALIVAHDWLELGMVSTLGLQNPVVQFIHGDYDYYYHLAEKHEPWVDNYLCVSNSVFTKLRIRLPQRLDSIHYLRVPVPSIQSGTKKDDCFHIVFAGRCEPAKGYFLLPEINNTLVKNNISIHWHIAGPGSDYPEIQKCWKNNNVTFYGNLSQSELYLLLKSVHVFVLPSLAEGMPISVVEAMKAGVVPVVNDLKGGLQEIIINNLTGYRISDNDPEQFALQLGIIVGDTKKLKRLSNEAQKCANHLFNPEINTELIERSFANAHNLRSFKQSQKVYGSTLDQPWLSNLVSFYFRKILAKSNLLV